MEKSYILFIVLNKVKKTRKIIKQLKEIGVEKYTLVNTFGSHNLCGIGQSYEPIVAGSFKSSMGHIKRKYNKTFFIVLHSEDEVLKVMDKVEHILEMEVDKPGDGIMFSVPIIMSQGLEKSSLS